MQRTGKTTLKFPRSYWLSLGTFLVMAAGLIFLALHGEGKDDRGVGIASGVIFFTPTMAVICWPIFRNNESNVVSTEFIHLFGLPCPAILFPMSKAKHFIIVIVH